MEISYYLQQWLLFNCCIMRKSKGYYILTQTLHYWRLYYKLNKIKHLHWKRTKVATLEFFYRTRTYKIKCLNPTVLDNTFKKMFIINILIESRLLYNIYITYAIISIRTFAMKEKMFTKLIKLN